MPEYCKNCLFLYAILNLFSLLCTNYISQELDGHFNDGNQLNFSIFTKNLNGTVFYGIDSNNKFLIEFTETLGEIRIFIQYNSYMTKEKITDLCKCSKCSDLYMTFELLLDHYRVIIHCGKQIQQFILDKLGDLKTFHAYPIPLTFNNSSNKTYIWMGNIGPYRGFEDIYYFQLPQQLVGCLDKLFYRGKLIIQNVKETRNGLFLSSCDIKLKEKIHTNNSFVEKERLFKMFDCSLRVMNGRYCTRQMNEHNGHTSFVRNSNNLEKGFIRLDWIQPNNVSDKNYCLMELKMKDGSFVIFYIDQFYEIIMKTRMENSKDYKSLIKSKTEKGVNNIITMDYNESFVVTRVYNGHDIVTYVDNFAKEFELINIGFCQHVNYLFKFEGIMDFYHDSKQFRKKTTEHTTPSFVANEINTYPIMIIVIILIAIFVITVVAIFRYKLRQGCSKIKVSSKGARSAEIIVTVEEDVYNVYSSPRTNSVYIMVSDPV